MTKCVVLWTSRKRTIIVSLTDGVEKILQVESKAKECVEDKWKRRLDGYYQEVIRAVGDAHDIFIFGSAEAKMGLKSEILKVEALSRRIVGTETADAMTETQLVERAREICRSRDV